ncbi:MAG: GNAT family protein [Candidatus Limnocylindrales bacterium]
MAAVELHGPRVVIRPLLADDRDAMATILAEPGVAWWWVHSSIEETIAELYDESDEEVHFAITVGGSVAGMIQFGEELTPDYRHASIDLFLGEAFQGRGLGPEAIRLVVRHLIDARGHHRLIIDPAVANARAIRAYESVGFRRVGVMRRYERGIDGTWHDGLLMDLLADELIDAGA